MSAKAYNRLFQPRISIRGQILDFTFAACYPFSCPASDFINIARYIQDGNLMHWGPKICLSLLAVVSASSLRS